MAYSLNDVVNRQFVTPIGSSDRQPAPGPAPLSAKELETLLSQRGLPITLGETLKGGTVSSVYAARGAVERPLVVKYTNDAMPFAPTELLLSHKSHYVDTELLRFLAYNSTIKVPDIVATWDDFPVTVMTDLRAEGYALSRVGFDGDPFALISRTHQ